MKKLGLVASFILMGSLLFAQGIKEGKQFLNYERYQSAENVFQKLLAAKPDDEQAAYWLGQSYLDPNRVPAPDTAKAKELYQKFLQANPKSELMMVGVGEVELMEGNKTDARNRFETAINNTKKRDLPDILYAVGRANIEQKSGDIMYGIEKLKQATERDSKNPELYNEIGYGYWKLHDGGNATSNYQTALSLDPTDARASFMIGRIYETQGYGQEPVYMRYYMDAMREDANFAPVYYWLYAYYYERDVNKAAEYLNKFSATSDNDSKLCYLKASLNYVSKKYPETISQADACITGTSQPFPNLYGLKGYAYDKMGDSLKAKQSFEKFFSLVNPDNIGPTDYTTYGRILMEFPGSEEEGLSYINKGLQMDTIVANKVKTISDIAKSFASKNNFVEAGKWYGKILDVDSAFGKTDLFYAGYNDYRGGNYKTADSVFQIYQKKYPEDVYGWYLGARAKEGMDTTYQLGLAKPFYEKVIEIGDTTQNKASIKSFIIPAYRYMVAYFYNIKNQVDSAVYFNNKILEVDPTDATALKAKDALASAAKQQAEAADKASKPAAKK